MVTGMNPTAVAADDQPVVQLSQLTKKYGEATAVDHLDLSISRGEIFGLLARTAPAKRQRSS